MLSTMFSKQVNVIWTVELNASIEETDTQRSRYIQDKDVILDQLENDVLYNKWCQINFLPNGKK